MILFLLSCVHQISISYEIYEYILGIPYNQMKFLQKIDIIWVIIQIQLKINQSGKGLREAFKKKNTLAGNSQPS